MRVNPSDLFGHAELSTQDTCGTIITVTISHLEEKLVETNDAPGGSFVICCAVSITFELRACLRRRGFHFLKVMVL